VTRQGQVAAGLSHGVVCAADTRILRVAIAREYEYGDRAVTTLAHEFRHVLEVLESPQARTEADVDRLFERIGYVRAAGIVETDAALAMGRIVEGELKMSSKSEVKTRRAGTR